MRFETHKWVKIRAPSCPEIPEMSQMSWNCPEISNCPEILLISSECPDMDLNRQICCHQVASFNAKIYQIRFWLGLCPRPYRTHPRPPPSWIWIVECKLNLLMYAYKSAGLLYSSYNNNIYEDRKMCISVSWALWNRQKFLKLSWNFLEIGSWNFTSCSWEPWNG